METLYFLKFWKPNASTGTPPNPSVAKDNEVEEEEEDSFFDLELSFDIIQSSQENNILDSKPKPNTSDKTAGGKQTLSLSASDPISKRKILPIEPVSRPPQSPIALLKSAPKFGALKFKNPRQKTEKKTGEKAECEVSMESQKQKIKGVIAKQLAGEEAQNPPRLTRENSSRRNGIGLQNLKPEDSKTERFSKDVLQKYLNLIKPLYSKVSRRSTEKVKPAGDSPTASPAMPIFSVCSPKKDKQGNFPAGFRVVCKNLGKSKSATVMAAPPVQRRDDSLLLHNDGIQSAILHCKRSFSSRDSLSSLSRSTSDSSSMKSYSTDSSLLSRIASDSHEKSARMSIEEEILSSARRILMDKTREKQRN
ncbi:hypothetical protein FF1_041999 [Malus domestica]